MLPMPGTLKSGQQRMLLAGETVNKVVNFPRWKGRVCAGLRPQARFGAQLPKAALSAEITQEGIHRRLKPSSESCVSAVWEPSSKQARLIRHRRCFACFPAPLKSLVFRTFIKVLKTCSAGRKSLFAPLSGQQLMLLAGKTLYFSLYS